MAKYAPKQCADRLYIKTAGDVDTVKTLWISFYYDAFSPLQIFHITGGQK